jgi:hypothetical protein
VIIIVTKDFVRIFFTDNVNLDLYLLSEGQAKIS